MSLQEEKLDHAEEIDEKDTSGTGYTHVEDPVLENKIVRHLDRRILPWLFALWLLAFIDRSSIGNAKIDGLIDDLNLTGNKYNISLTVFYILYVLVDIPSNWLLKVVGGGRYLPMLALAWGIVGTCMGAVKSYPALIACRMLLGACEGGMFGGIILYLSMFYKRHQLMFRLGVSTFRFAQRV
jgi:MFS family permease